MRLNSFYLDIFDSFGNDLIGLGKVGRGVNSIKNSGNECQSAPAVFHLDEKCVQVELTLDCNMNASLHYQNENLRKNWYSDSFNKNNNNKKTIAFC